MYALNKLNQLVPINEAKIGTDRHFTCPECKNDVFLKSIREIQKKAHFCHVTGCECSYSSSPLSGGEGINHLDAKYKLIYLFENYKKFKIESKCVGCNSLEEKEVYKRVGYEAKMEYLLKDGGRADIAILKNGQLKYIIEIYDTHRTKERSCEWYELKAKSVLEGNYICSRIRICEECQRQNIINELMRTYKYMIMDYDKEYNQIYTLYSKTTKLLINENNNRKEIYQQYINIYEIIKTNFCKEIENYKLKNIKEIERYISWEHYYRNSIKRDQGKEYDQLECYFRYSNYIINVQINEEEQREEIIHNYDTIRKTIKKQFKEKKKEIKHGTIEYKFKKDIRDFKEEEYSERESILKREEEKLQEIYKFCKKYLPKKYKKLFQ